MIYDVQIDGRSYSIDVEREAGEWRVRVDGEHVEMGVSALGERTLSLLIGHGVRTFQMHAQESGNGSSQWLVGSGGRQFAAEVRDRRHLRRGPHGVEQEGRIRLTTPMAGKVVRILLRAGEAVEAGQAVLVLEAMKMQNEVRSPKSGTLVRLAVEENSAVGTGQLLAEIE